MGPEEEGKKKVKCMWTLQSIQSTLQGSKIEHESKGQRQEQWLLGLGDTSKWTEIGDQGEIDSYTCFLTFINNHLINVVKVFSIVYDYMVLK